MDSGAIAYVRQQKALGLGHAVWCARRLIGDEPFAVILPDDVIDAETPCLQQMIEAYAETGGNMVATMEVPPENVSSYGILDVDEDMGAMVLGQGHGREAEGRGGAVEPGGDRPLHPDAEGAAATSTDVKAGAGGEIQLTDAIAEEIAQANNVYGFRFSGRRFDCGSKAGFLQATVAFGLARVRTARRVPRSS